MGQTQISQLITIETTDNTHYLIVDNGDYTFKIKVDVLLDQYTGPIEETIINLKQLIKTETDTRSKADTTLQTNIDSEAKARQSADTNLSNALTTETKERKSADSTLQENIDTEKSQRLLNVDSLRNDVNKCKKVFEYINPTDTTYLIRHDLSTKDFLINVYSINGKDLNPTIERLDGDNVQLTFDDIPEDFRVVIFAINEWALEKLAFNLPS